MPRHEESWDSFAEVIPNLQLGEAAREAAQAWLGARVLAGDWEERDKVQPFALGIFHRRAASRAVSRVFRGRVAAALGDGEDSAGNARGAEFMNQAALLDLDSRPGCCKLSLDASSAHNRRLPSGGA
ncbi:unnamed protein product [Prorocentrum cordatum]|uniref:Uncharacterized protein n=1 Tax=Prorocentrum cordatum TaxID=2364126 RepID=A0ABN9TSA5_9DINO|nr:unnamed protein product [Polarella glacialis]